MSIKSRIQRIETELDGQQTETVIRIGIYDPETGAWLIPPAGVNTDPEHTTFITVLPGDPEPVVTVSLPANGREYPPLLKQA